MSTHQELFMRLFGSWLIEYQLIDYEIVDFIYKLVFEFVEVRMHFVLEPDCSYCCGRSEISVFPFDAPCGPAQSYNDKNEKIICTDTRQVGRGDEIYCQTNRNLALACHGGWTTIEIHNALADCKAAGSEDDLNVYDKAIVWTWHALCQQLE